jgi:ribosomal protein L3 glutamine methyltransferase
MTTADLERQLNQAVSHEDQLQALARFFARHGLAFGHGTDNAEDEAFWLLRHLQRWRADAWQAVPDRSLTRQAVELAVRRVEQRKPLAYLLGEAWFAGLTFKVDERVLVPRSPLAEVIERGFMPWCALRPGDRLLDIGTGSGCLAIAAAYYSPSIRVDATDISAAALAVAADNVHRHGMRDRVRLLEADLFPPGDGRYRVIMSNPPYVPNAELARLPPEYVSEPAVALSGGVTGLELAGRILRGARAALEPDGILLVEVGGGADAFAETYPRLPVTWIELERGGDGVLMLTAGQLSEFL